MGQDVGGGFEKKQGSQDFMLLKNKKIVEWQDFCFYGDMWKRRFYIDKCDYLFCLRGYLLIGNDWSLNVGDRTHNHEMVEALQGHKTAGNLWSDESRLLHELKNSMVPPRHILNTSPKVVVIERENALMSDVDIVFLKATGLLYEYHM